MLLHIFASALLIIGIRASVLAGRQATAMATATAGIVSGVTVTDSGSGYQFAPGVSFSGGGGNGATAVAVLEGDKVAAVVVTTGGSGYSLAPTVTMAPPPALVVPATLSIDTVPRITVAGAPGSTHLVEWADAVGDPTVWHPLTNVILGASPAVLIDASVTAGGRRIYRAVNTGGGALIPSGMALIPAGLFLMGDTFGDVIFLTERPVHSVFVSAFYLDQYEVTKALWDEVKGWSSGHGYGFNNPGVGKAANHPVHSVNWYDVVKWCNARSQKEGRVPAYYTDAALTQVYKTGLVAPYVKWAAGYRLPTEAEWEKAARGGRNANRFPWSDDDNIMHSRANYYSGSSNFYDVSLTREYHPTYSVGGFPYTSPAGSFAANGYGLYDMAGNVWEWCWDWYGSYSSGSQTDPRGQESGSNRVFRGGGWDSDAIFCRSAFRFNDGSPEFRYFNYGFRSVLPPGQP